MPVYEYRCTQCQQIFEYQQRMADPAKTACEACSGALERLISRSSFALKGSGWYKDLYSSAKPEAATPAAATPTAPAAGATPAAAPAAAAAAPASSGDSGGSSTPAPSVGSGTKAAGSV